MPQNSHSRIASPSAEEKNKTEGEGTELFSRPVGVLGLVWEGLVWCSRERRSLVAAAHSNAAQSGWGEFPEDQGQRLAAGLWELLPRVGTAGSLQL